MAPLLFSLILIVDLNAACRTIFTPRPPALVSSPYQKLKTR